MMDEWGSGYYGGGSAGGALMMVLLWALVIAGIVVLVRYVAKNNRPESATTALDVLKSRYAKGEIDKAEFEQKRKDLKD